MMKSHKMLYVLPQIIWSGISLSIYTGLLVPIIMQTIPADEAENTKLMKSIFAMTFLGVGEVFGSLLVGQIIDKLGSRVTVTGTISLIVIQSVVALKYIF
jgi:MFS family permease